MKDLVNMNVTTMTLKEITDLLEVRHNNAMRVVEEMVKQVEFGLATKIKQPITSGKGRKQLIETYQLNKRQSIAVAARLNTNLLMRIIDRWQELESQQTFNIPTTLSGALRLASEQAELIEKQNALLSEQAPKVAFHDAVEASETSIPIGVFSKLLAIPGLGRNNMFAWFRENGYIGKRGREHNVARQAYVKQGLFEVIEKTITKPSGEDLIIYTTLITGKGQIYFEKKLREDFI